MRRVDDNDCCWIDDDDVDDDDVDDDETNQLYHMEPIQLIYTDLH